MNGGLSRLETGAGKEKTKQMETSEYCFHHSQQSRLRTCPPSVHTHHQTAFLVTETGEHIPVESVCGGSGQPGGGPFTVVQRPSSLISQAREPVCVHKKKFPQRNFLAQELILCIAPLRAKSEIETDEAILKKSPCK